MKASTLKEAKFYFIVLGAIVITAFSTTRMHQRMDELTVKRINIIEDDGTLRMVLSNKTKQHPGRMDGQDLPQRDRSAGIIFFNDIGDECGGIGFEVQQSSGAISNGMVFTMDRFKHDQVVQLMNSEYIVDGKIMSYRGLGINSIPDEATLTEYMKAMEEASLIIDEAEKRQKMMAIHNEMGSTNRLFMGKSREGNHGLFIMDEKGVPKLMLFVDSEGNPKIQTFDENMEPKDLIQTNN